MKWARAGVVGAVALAVLLTGCRAPGTGGPTVVTSFYPLYFLADDIAGRFNDVVDLTPPGVEPHEYELTVRTGRAGRRGTRRLLREGRGAVGRPGDGQRLPRARARGDQRRPPALAVDRVLRGDRRRPRPALLAGPVADGDRGSGLRGHDGRRRPRPRGVLPEARRTPGRAAAPAGPRLRPHRSPPAGSARSWSATTPSSTSAVATTSTSSRSPGSSPTPSRRCSTSRTCPALIRERHHHRLLRDAGHPRPGATRWPTTSASRSGVLDPIEGLTSDDAHATYLTLMRQNLAAIAQANGCTT